MVTKKIIIIKGKQNLSFQIKINGKSESEEILNRIKSYRGVVGVLVVNNEGLIIKSTFDQQQSDLHASLLTQLSTKARDIIRELDPQNDISFLRLRSKKHEIMIAPDKDYTLIVVQNPYADKDKN
ncbi:dynein light chain roadblock-type [Plasmodium vinckei petteri]|uniref:Dynein light chain roadblock-type n=1 Tax=Plasmodium vinckei petteri TaxID=138298 RepID=W7AF22_PLAVN|nr:dynein light chain roadblock-type [Plasmodium vinckei petteri]